MKRPRIPAVFLLAFLCVAWLAPRPTAALPVPIVHAKIVVPAGQDETIVSPRAPRRRDPSQPSAVSLAFLSATAVDIIPSYWASMAGDPEDLRPSVSPPCGAGVTRAGPSILS